MMPKTIISIFKMEMKHWYQCFEAERKHPKADFLFREVSLSFILSVSHFSVKFFLTLLAISPF